MDFCQYSIKSKAVRCGIAVIVVMIIYAALLGTDSSNDAFAIGGGLVGAVSSLIVIINYIAQRTDYKAPFSLLFWRAFCDLGLAIRFVAIPGFNILLCNNVSCSRGGSDESLCGFPSAMFEFFSIASEAWFLCNGLDLYYSVTNPFSSLKNRMFSYHIFVWTVALMFACLPLISRHRDRIFGFWYVNPDMDESAVCWIKVDKNSLSLPIWILFFIPLLFIYTVCCVSLIIAYARLKRGITRTFLPRMKLLVTNTANVIVLILYWFVLVFFYSFAFFTRYQSYNIYIADILAFIFASKGFSSLIVWILVTDRAFKSVAVGGTENGEAEDIDANKALREEVLNFATAGIRSSARAGPKATPDRREITRMPQSTLSSSGGNSRNLITPFFFIRFVLGQHDEVRAVENMVGNKRRSVNASFKRQTIRSSDIGAGDDAEGEDGSDVEMANLTANNTTTNTQSIGGGQWRFSQRPTDVAGVLRSDKEATRRDSTPSVRASEVDTTGRYASEMSTRPSEMIEAADPDEADARATTVDHTAGAGFMEIVNNNIFSRMFSKLKSCLLDATETVEFTEFEPFYFRQIRLSVGITDDIYINYFSTTIKERLTQGGASGAFFFFSKGEKFIAKSCTASELDSLKGSAARYSDYLTKNKDSFISKIFGAYRLKIYGTSLHFFVMGNIFLNPEGLLMNEKYDIKGSWVARNAETPSNGQSVTCTHCEQKYTYYKKNKKTSKALQKKLMQPAVSRVPSTAGYNGDSGINPLDIGTTLESFVVSNPLKAGGSSVASSVDDEASNTGTTYGPEKEQQHCPYTVGGHHEPNVILKDNDLKYKIRLPLPTAVHLLRQVQMDAEFLYSIGVCDYSLLVGVHNTEYEVQQQQPAGPEDSAVVCGVVSPRKALIKKASAVNVLSSSSRDSGDSSPLHKAENGTITPFSNGAEDTTRSSGGGEDIQITRKLEVYKVAGPDAYFMGIIDYQQKWNFKKQLERFFKINFRGADPEGLSAINPDVYKERFLRKIEDILDFDNLSGAGSGVSRSNSAVPSIGSSSSKDQ